MRANPALRFAADPGKVVSIPRFAANLSWMLQEIPILDRFAATRGLGFEAVECQLPYDHPAEELARACGDEKL